MAELTDDEALTLAIEGDSEAFGVLYERFVGKIYNYIYYRTGNVAEAEDLTARVFQRALGHICSYRSRGVPFSAWLYRIAHNLVANWHRDNSRRNEVPLDDFQPEPVLRSEHPESRLVQDQEVETLMHALRKLTPDRQQVIILKFVERLTNAEVAMIMRRSEGAIKSLYHRTLLTLREQMDTHEPTEDLTHVKDRD